MIELEGPKKRPNKSTNLKSTVKSFLSNHTSLRRSLVFVVILFQLYLVLYLTRTYHLTVSESPQPFLEFQARESKIVLKIWDSVNKGTSKVSSETYVSLPNKGASSVSSKAYASLPNKGTSKVSSETYASLPNKGASNISSKVYASLPNKGASNVSSKAYAILPNKGASKVSSETYASLPNKEESNVSSKAYASVLNKGTPNVSSKAYASLPDKGASKVSLETYASLSNKEESNVSSEAYASLPNKGATNVSSETYTSLLDKGKSNVLSEPYASLPNKGASRVSSETHASLPNKSELSTSLKTHGSLPIKGCDSGLIYVYDLPPMFNYDHMNDCAQLDQGFSKCDKNLNDGLGPEATEFTGIVPESILPALYWTDQYWGEVMYHHRMQQYKCRTLEPVSATAFYIPFYAGLAVMKHLFDANGRERDRHAELLIKWVQEQKWWNRSNGSDHFIMLGRVTWDFRRSREADAEWGSSFIHMPAMQNVIRLSVERSEWDTLEVAVPYPTIFHPRSNLDIILWQKFVRRHKRNHLFTYVGSDHDLIKNDFRAILRNQCLNESTACHYVECGWDKCLDGQTVVMEAFLDSDFCLQPRGNGYTSRLVFDCMLAGSIPVFFWRRTAYVQYEFFMPTESEDYSVFIHRDDVRNGTDITRVLQGYRRNEVARMRKKVVEFIPRFVYAKHNQGIQRSKDAFDIAIDGVLTKYKDHMEKGRIGNRDAS